MLAQPRRSTFTLIKCNDAPSQCLLIVAASKCSVPWFFISPSQLPVNTARCVSFKAAFFFVHLDKQRLLLRLQHARCCHGCTAASRRTSSAASSHAREQAGWGECSDGAEGGCGDDVTMCLIFTSHVIALIKKSNSSDSWRVYVGWLEGLDWKRNKQGLLPTPRAAKAIKWSLRWRPSRLCWPCCSSMEGGGGGVKLPHAFCCGCPILSLGLRLTRRLFG